MIIKWWKLILATKKSNLFRMDDWWKRAVFWLLMGFCFSLAKTNQLKDSKHQFYRGHQVSPYWSDVSRTITYSHKDFFFNFCHNYCCKWLRLFLLCSSDRFGSCRAILCHSTYPRFLRAITASACWVRAPTPPLCMSPTRPNNGLQKLLRKRKFQ